MNSDFVALVFLFCFAFCYIYIYIFLITIKFFLERFNFIYLALIIGYFFYAITGLEIWSLFAYGSVKFIWDKSPDDLTYFVNVSRNRKQDLSWIRVANPEFTVNDVLLYDIISITVSAPRLSNEYYKKEHKGTSLFNPSNPCNQFPNIIRMHNQSR